MQTVRNYVGWRTIRGVRAPAGYGYGLRIQFEDVLGTMVTHSGGFPGYGSTMRWLQGDASASWRSPTSRTLR